MVRFSKKWFMVRSLAAYLRISAATVLFWTVPCHRSLVLDGKRIQTAIFYSLVLSALLLLGSCGTGAPADEAQLPSNDSTAFFPIHQFFTSQIQAVDSVKPVIRLVTTEGQQKDSQVISAEQFGKIAHLFLQDNIADPSVKRYYRQSVFQDNSTGSITFNYTTVNAALPVQNLDVLIDTVSQQVKRVFISKIRTVRDSTIIEKLSWKTDTGFVINRMIRTDSDKEFTRQLRVRWAGKD